MDSQSWSGKIMVGGDLCSCLTNSDEQPMLAVTTISVVSSNDSEVMKEQMMSSSRSTRRNIHRPGHLIK